MTLEEAFQKLNIIQDFIPPSHSNRPGRRLTPTHVTIHNTDNANRGADAAAHARYAKGADARKREVSWHYTVDDRSVYQSLPDNEIGWHAGPGNSKSIGIEICMHQGMNEAAAYERAALLVAVLALQNGIPLRGRIVQHNHWTGKNCPSVLRRSGWTSFLELVREAHAELSSPARSAVARADRDIELVLAKDEDDCELLNSKAPIGAARRGSKSRSAAKKKSAARKRR